MAHNINITLGKGPILLIVLHWGKDLCYKYYTGEMTDKVNILKWEKGPIFIILE